MNPSPAALLTVQGAGMLSPDPKLHERSFEEIVQISDPCLMQFRESSGLACDKSED